MLYALGGVPFCILGADLLFLLMMHLCNKFNLCLVFMHFGFTQSGFLHSS
jgi:hypothetical protein